MKEAESRRYRLCAEGEDLLARWKTTAFGGGDVLTGYAVR